MMKSKLITIALWGLLGHVMTSAQPMCKVVKYDEADGVPSNHITQLLQDGEGLMWFATWNGLCRFDGYEFQTFKPQVGDGCRMTTDRIRNITMLPSGNILCQTDEGRFMFDKATCKFRNLTDDEQKLTEEQVRQYTQSRSLLKGRDFTWTDGFGTSWTLHTDGRLTYRDGESGLATDCPTGMSFRTLTFAMTDSRGSLWALDYDCIYQFCTDMQRTERLPIEPHAEVKCLFNDWQGRYWVTTKGDNAVRVYHSSDDRLLGYLGSDGRLHQSYTSFGAAVYCMLQTQDGCLWLGTKPDGLYRLRPKTAETFDITHLTRLPFKEIYHLKEDRWGRLWVAALDGGLCYTDHPQEENPPFSIPHHYPQKEGRRARFIYITKDDVLLTTTSGGLLAARLEKDAAGMRFLLHQREPGRKQSLSCSATMDVAQDGAGRFFVSTESGGVNQIMTNHLLDSTFSFRHLRDHFHVQANDIVLSLTPLSAGGLMAVGSHRITLIDSTTQGRVLDVCNFNANYRFSEAHPLPLSNHRWLFGLMDGASIMTEEQLLRQAYNPRLVLTSLAIQGGDSNWAIEQYDTLTLQPYERSLTIHFAALDFHAPERISYAFRLSTVNAQLSTVNKWNYIGHDRSATLLDMSPGTYLLEIRSTNADGEWQQNSRLLTIVVRPTFWESVWGRLLLALLLCGTMAAIAYTIYYIRRIKRQQHETLEKYLALIEVRDQEEIKDKQDDVSPHLSATEPQPLDPMLQRVMAYVEENISNSDANVGDMASAAATSRSGLQRKLKQTMGITPQDLLREARIKRACQLLRQTDKNIAEIAYACGFTDPKYFSRSFKQSTGKAPTEMRNEG